MDDILNEFKFLSKTNDKLKKENDKKELRKVNEKDIKQNPSILKKAIDKIYKNDKDHIAGDIVPVFKICRVAFIIGGTAMINPALAVLAYLIDTLIEEKVNEKHRGTITAKLVNEINHNKKKYEEENDPEKKKEYKYIIDHLESQKRKLDDYYESITSYRHDDKKEDKDDFDMNESTILLNLNEGENKSPISKKIHDIYSNDNLDPTTKFFNLKQVFFMLITAPPFVAGGLLSVACWMLIHLYLRTKVAREDKDKMEKVFIEAESKIQARLKKEKDEKMKKELEKSLKMLRHNKMLERQDRNDGSHLKENMLLVSESELNIYKESYSDKYEYGLIYNGLVSLQEHGYDLSEELVGTIRHHMKVNKEKFDSRNDRVSRKVDHIDDVINGDKVQQKEKNEVRNQVMDGKMSLSRKIKYAIKIGVPTALLGPISGMLTGVVLLARRKKMSIDERRRLIHEFNTELELIDEKIKDADSKGDLKLKYRLMRLRKEIMAAQDKLKWGINIKTGDSALRAVKSEDVEDITNKVYP